MAKKQKIDDLTIKAYLEDAIASANSYDDLELTDKRTKAIEYYRGVMRDVPHQPGKSGVVSRDLAVIIGWMLPGIMRIFTGSDRICRFMPNTMRDEEYCDQVSDYLNYKFMRECDGYSVLWNLIHDSLMHGDGIAKVWWDDTPEYETFTYTGLSEEQLTLLINSNDVEVLASTQTELIDEESGQVMPVFDLKIQRIIRDGNLKFAAIEPENFLMDKLYDTIEESRFQAQRDTVTKSDLVEMGFDRKLVDSLSTDVLPHLDEDEKMARDGWDHTHFQMQDDSVQTVELYECYIKMDVDDDGMAETLRCMYAGNQGTGVLLDWEVWDDEVPFVAIQCEPVPHRFDSNGISDQTMDIQRIKTVLNRNLLDNIYAHNNPQPEFEEGSVLNRDSIISPKPGQPIIRKRGSAPLAWRDIPFVADKTLMAVQAMDNELERRTGVSRSTMALDPEAIQNVTATAVNEQKAAATSKAELCAKNQSEGLARLFNKAHRLTVKHQDRTDTIKLRGEWVEVDPRVWNANMKCVVETGLGTGSRERDMMVLQQTLQIQNEHMDRFGASGMTEQATQMIPKVLKTSRQIAETAGLKDSDSYFIPINPQQMASIAQKAKENEQQPSPEEKKIQAEMQLEQQRLQMEMQRDQQQFEAKMQLEMKKAEGQVTRERAQMEADIQVKTTEAQLNAEYQMKELANRREKEMNDFEIDKAKLVLEEREVAVKEYEAGMKSELESARIGMQGAMSEDKLDLEYERISSQERAAKAQAQANGRTQEGQSGTTTQ